MQTSRRALSVLANAGFVVIGVVSTLVGAVLPALAAKWMLDDFHSGSLFTAQFVGSMTGVTASNVLARRVGFSRSIALGFVLIVIGILGLNVHDFPLGVIATFICGAGLGITIPGTNMLVASIDPARSAQALNILNFMWGVGAVIGPASVWQITFRFHLSYALWLVAIMVGVLVVTWLLVDPEAAAPPQTVHTNGKPEAKARLRIAALIGVFVFVYIGIENAISGWISSQGSRLVDPEKLTPGMFPSIFFVALLLGRVLAPLFLRIFSPGRLSLIGLILALPGIAIFISTENPSWVLLGTFVTGFGFGPVFPNTVALLSRTFGSAPSRASSTTFALAGLGGATIPWLVGIISSQYHSLSTGLSIALVGNAIIISLQLFLTTSERLMFAKSRDSGEAAT